MFVAQLSHGSPLAAVCARGDLDTALPDARGCFDTKVTSYDLALDLQADAITGPTTQVHSPAFLNHSPVKHLPARLIRPR